MALDSGLQTKLTAFANKLKQVFEQKSNKVTSWSSTTTDTNYPSEKLVKDSLDTKITKTQTDTGFLKSDGSVDNSTYLTQHQDLSDYISKTPTDTGFLKSDGSIDSTEYQEAGDYYELTENDTGFVRSDGSIDNSVYLTQHQDLSNYITKSQTTGLVKNDGTIDTNTYLTSHQDLSDYIQKTQTDTGFVKSDGSIDDTTYLTSSDVSLDGLGGIIDVEKQTTADTGYAATYVIKQGTSSSKTAISTKINIPKDFLVKSGEVKTATAADLTTLGNGYTAGDKYIDFVINTKEDDGTDEHMYINVKDLVEDTTYEADESTVHLSNGVFSIKSSGVDTTQINDSAVTTAKINDGAVTADKIASAVKNSWLDTEDVDTEIGAAVEYLTTALSN